MLVTESFQTKVSTIHKIYRRGQSTKEADCHGSKTGISVCTGGPVDGFWTGFRSPDAHQLFTSYGEIDEVDLEENAAKMIGSYELMEHLACLIEQL